jgi:hypothetical protein
MGKKSIKYPLRIGVYVWIFLQGTMTPIAGNPRMCWQDRKNRLIRILYGFYFKGPKRGNPSDYFSASGKFEEGKMAERAGFEPAVHL